MKILGAIALTSVFLLPNIAWAACVASGATVIYTNGIFSTEEQAKNDLKKLNTEYFRITRDRSIKFINGYNPSHLAGLGDLAQSVAQMKGASISNFDRDTILLQIHPQLTTRKVALVGHSQGAFYANALYDYLLAHGEPRAAVGVYQVGSPASFVAGNGKYLNSSGDVMLSTLRGLGFTFLPNNIDLVSSADDSQKKYPGHSFSTAYLAEAPDKVVGDLQKTLAGLKAEQASNTGECFTAPDTGVGYQAAKAGFAVADTAAGIAKTGLVGAQKVGAAVGDSVLAAAAGALGLGKKVAADVGVTVGGIANLSHAATNEVRPTNFDIFEKLYGSSLSKDDVKELLGNQGSAVATADIFSAPTPVAAPARAATPQATSPAPKKITYLSGGHSRRDSDDDNDESESTVEEPAPDSTGSPQAEPEPVPEPEPDSTSSPQAEPEPEPEPEEEEEPAPLPSQSDYSTFCADPIFGIWIGLGCYGTAALDENNQIVGVEVDEGGNLIGRYVKELGTGLSVGIESVTIANAPLDVFHPWLITIECFTDNAYTTVCEDWVAASSLTGGRTDALTHTANESDDGKFWTAYFAPALGNPEVTYPTNFDGSLPVRFNHMYYYRLSINDQGWGAPAYGSATEPYWVITTAP